MTDLRARLADALRDQWTPSTVVYGTDEPVGFGSPWDWARHVADVLLSLPDIAIIELDRVDKIAEVIARSWPEDRFAKSWPWSEIPEYDREAYREMARASLLAAANTADSP